MRLNTLPDIWKPAFTLGYALSFVVIERAVSLARWSPSSSVTLAALVGFLGILSTTLVPVVMAVWAGLAVWRVLRAGLRVLLCARRDRLAASGRSLALLLLVGGGVFAGVLDGSVSGVDWRLSWIAGTGRLWPRLTRGRAGGPAGNRALGGGCHGRGPGASRSADRGAGGGQRAVLVLFWIAITYPAAPGDVDRFSGHARNFALVALVLALAAGWRRVQARSGVCGGKAFCLSGWSFGPRSPSHCVAPPSRSGTVSRLRTPGHLAIASGPTPRRLQTGALSMPTVSDRLADYIRTHDGDRRASTRDGSSVLECLLATGRPNTAGFAGLVHQRYYHEPGPSIADAVRFLEPAALRRLGIDYIHATDSWAGALPRARSNGSRTRVLRTPDSRR